jgi:heme/copper-type cytochrome/quinol oxidase subunit 1
MDEPIKLHPVTWVMLIGFLLQLASSLIDVLQLAYPWLLYPDVAMEDNHRALLVSLLFRSIADSLFLISSAVMVEFLYRIWRELRFANRRPAPDLAIELIPKHAPFETPS